MGKSLRTVQKYENGEINISVAMINEIARVLEVPSTYLLGYKKDGAKIECLSDIMDFLFCLEKMSGIKFDIDVKRPPHFDGWECSLKFNGKDMSADYNASPTYLKAIQNQITAIFNYAVKYYNLKENPCHKAGSMGKKHADEMLFWTKDEFAAFIEAVSDKPMSYAIFMTFYYTGIREGELLALTPADIDFDKKTLTVNKSYQRINREDVITTPKTPKSNRVVSIPQLLCDCLQEYMPHCYELQPNDRLFPCTKHFLQHEMERGCKISGIKRIRVHDIRHSHASLLVEMGFSPLLIAER